MNSESIDGGVFVLALAFVLACLHVVLVVRAWRTPEFSRSGGSRDLPHHLLGALAVHVNSCAMCFGCGVQTPSWSCRLLYVPIASRVGSST